MNYYGLKSIIASGKKSLKIKNPTESFDVSSERTKPYIEPTFDKVIFEVEKPAVICISAVGATGKSSLAQILSQQLEMPLLDLATYKPVGANSLTGLLTSSYDSSDLSEVFSGLENGSFGIIIDGVDEGRSKTTQMGFEAFLEDIALRCSGSPVPSIILLGRSQTLEESFFFLSNKGLEVGLVNILPFDLVQACEYIDRYTEKVGTQHEAEYKEARDLILEKLRSAFNGESAQKSENFLSFIGYPPVLDAIVTLLLAEQNYHRLLQTIRDNDSDDIEIDILYRIASYIMTREKDQKVIPNILEPILHGFPAEVKEKTTQVAFQELEQCMRLISHSLGMPYRIDCIDELPINNKYEEQMESWLPEHPFLSENKFRNAVFESVALATMIASDDPRCISLVRSYVSASKRSYYLIYLLDKIVSNNNIPIAYLDILVDSALEFRSSMSYVRIDVDGPDYQETETDPSSPAAIDIEIEILLGKQREAAKVFSFQSTLDETSSVKLGNRLAETYVSLPCDVIFTESYDLEFSAPVSISAKNIEINSKTLTIKHSQEEQEDAVTLESATLRSTLEAINDNGVALSAAVSDISGLTYPIIRYTVKREELPSDGQLKEKYLRLKRILMEFRSHGRGSLARRQMKIENERVLRNDIGRNILKRLLDDEIFTLSGGLYFIQSDRLDEEFDMSWPDWKQDRISERLLKYLQLIQIN